eukprot:5226619-Amphidinium_carterae.1
MQASKAVQTKTNVIQFSVFLRTFGKLPFAEASFAPQLWWKPETHQTPSPTASEAIPAGVCCLMGCRGRGERL